jgi:hypothetical protein
MHMPLPTLPADKANHHLYGAWITVTVFIACMLLAMQLQAPGIMVLAPFAGVLAALLAGLHKEWRDSVANARARAAGQPEPHQVSAHDVRATVLGGLPVVLPWLTLLVLGLAGRHG